MSFMVSSNSDRREDVIQATPPIERQKVKPISKSIDGQSSLMVSNDFDDDSDAPCNKISTLLQQNQNMDKFNFNSQKPSDSVYMDIPIPYLLDSTNSVNAITAKNDLAFNPFLNQSFG